MAAAAEWPELTVTVVDVNETALAAGRQRAREAGLTNCEFVAGDVQDPAARQACAPSGGPVHSPRSRCGLCSNVMALITSGCG